MFNILLGVIIEGESGWADVLFLVGFLLALIGGILILSGRDARGIGHGLGWLGVSALGLGWLML